MKKLVSLFTLVITAQSIAAINCKSFNDEVDYAQSVVDNFDGELAKLQSKLLKLEDRISDKLSLIEPIQYQIQSTSLKIKNLKDQRRSIKQVLDEKKSQLQIDLDQESSLISEINSLLIQIDNLGSRDSRRRALLREKNIKEKLLERVQVSIASAEDSIRPLQHSIRQVRDSVALEDSKLISLEQEKSIVENQVPKLHSLQNLKANVVQELNDQDYIAQNNLLKLDEAIEKQLMCKTYTVKYDLSLEIAKEIYDVGCVNYQLRDLKGKFKKQAEIETLNSICNM